MWTSFDHYVKYADCTYFQSYPSDMCMTLPLVTLYIIFIDKSILFYLVCVYESWCPSEIFWCSFHHRLSPAFCSARYGRRADLAGMHWVFCVAIQLENSESFEILGVVWREGESAVCRATTERVDWRKRVRNRYINTKGIIYIRKSAQPHHYHEALIPNIQIFTGNSLDMDRLDPSQ